MIGRNHETLSFRKTPVKSPSTHGAVGHYNFFGGFHPSTDAYAYVGAFKLLFTLLVKRQIKNSKWVWTQIWRLWMHRRCDTTDFHHNIYCMYDPWSRKRDAQDRWHEVWTT